MIYEPQRKLETLIFCRSFCRATAGASSSQLGRSQTTDPAVNHSNDLQHTKHTNAR